jgi:hypothetical protein
MIKICQIQSGKHELVTAMKSASAIPIDIIQLAANQLSNQQQLLQLTDSIVVESEDEAFITDTVHTIRKHCDTPILVLSQFITDHSLEKYKRLQHFAHCPSADYLSGLIASFSLSTKTTSLSILDCCTSAKFQIRSLRHAYLLAHELARLYPSRYNYLRGIYELLANALEHGVLSITHEEKAELQRDGNYISKIDTELSQVEGFCTVIFSVESDMNILQIKDPGSGFNFEEYLDKCNAHKLPGKGIIYANTQCFDHLRYLHHGACCQAIAPSLLKT